MAIIGKLRERSGIIIGAIAVSILGSVSYTHLDVYKRQTIHRAYT